MTNVLLLKAKTCQIGATMPTAHHESCCKCQPSGILWGQDIFGEYVEPVTGFQPSKGQFITVLSGEPIFSSGQTPVPIVFLRSGQALLTRKNSKSIPIHAPEDGEPVFGIVESLCSTTFDTDLTAVTDCDVRVFSPDELFGCVRRDPALGFRLAQVIADLYIRAVRMTREH